MKVKVIMSIHGFTDGKYSRVNLWNNFAAVLTDKIVVVSEAFKRTMTSNMIVRNNKYVVIHNATNLEKRDPSQLEEIELFRQEKNPVFGMVANFVPGKDHMTVLSALDRFLTENPEVRFVFIGQKFEHYSDIFDRCFKYVEHSPHKKKIRFLGRIDNISQALNSIDIFILSSISESFGISVVEAMFHKKPCILSNIEVLREISGEGEYALLFEPGSAEDLYLQMNNLYHNLPVFTEKVNQAYVNAKTKFSIDNHIHSLSNLYHSLC